MKAGLLPSFYINLFMKVFSLLLGIFLFNPNIFGQKKNRLSIQISQGINGNFFVRSYDEQGGPANKKYFYKKDFLGTISGINAEYQISSSSLIVVDFFKSTNLGRKNYAGNINGVDLFISDFRLRHLNRILSLGYGYQSKRNKSTCKLDAGFTLIYDVQQVITLENWDNYISINENNFKNSNAVEGGVFFGASWQAKIDTRFDLGLKARIYYLVSTNELECVSLSPTLTYHF